MLVISLTACSANNGPERADLHDKLNITLPPDWSEMQAIGDNPNHDSIADMVSFALQNNQQLKQQAYALAADKLKVTVSQSELWPQITAGLSSQRRKTTSDTFSNDSELSLDISYELDLWGKLSAAEQNATLSYLSAEQAFIQSKQTLAAEVIKSYLEIIQAKQLLHLYKSRREAAKNNLLIVERGHKLGLNEAP